MTSNAYVIAHLTHRAFQHIAHTEFAADLPHVYSLAFISEAGTAGDHEQPANAAESGDDLLDHAVSEILLLGVAAQVLKRQDRNGRLVGQGERYSYPALVEPHTMDANRTCDVLDLLWPMIIEIYVDLAHDIALHAVGNTDAARFGKRFEARCDIDAIAEDVVLLNDYVANIDADPKRNAPLVWNVPLTLHHPALDPYSAAHSVHNARELRQETIAGVLYGTAPVLFDLWFNELPKMGFEALVRPLLVRSHETAIAGHVGG